MEVGGDLQTGGRTARRAALVAGRVRGERAVRTDGQHRIEPVHRVELERATDVRHVLDVLRAVVDRAEALRVAARDADLDGAPRIGGRGGAGEDDGDGGE